MQAGYRVAGGEWKEDRGRGRYGRMNTLDTSLSLFHAVPLFPATSSSGQFVVG